MYVPQRQRVLVKTSGEFERIAAIPDIRILAEELAATPEQFVTYLPSSTASELIRGGTLTARSHAVWSMWDGYLNDPSGHRLVADLASAGIPFSSLHTSGHATVRDLQTLAEALAPTQVVPIHTDAADRFVDLFERAVLHPDGTWWAAWRRRSSTEVCT